MIGWGIIGIGKHAGSRMAPSFRRTSSSKLVAVCSRDANRAAAFAARHGAEVSYDSYERMLANTDVQAVYVSTPHSLHPQHVAQALKAGKHVLCEKPLALAEADAREMVGAARRAGVALGLCFQNRHHPAHIEVRRLVAEGQVGSVPLVRLQYSYLGPGEWAGWRADPAMVGAGALMGLAVHPLDLLRYVTGEEIVELSALMDNHPSTGKVDYNVVLLLRLSGGGFAMVDACRRIPLPTSDIVVYGSKLRVSTLNTVGMNLGGSLEVVDDGRQVRSEYSDPDPTTGLFARMIDDFSTAVAEGRPPRATGEDGIVMARITEAALRSAREGCAVRLDG